MKKVLWVAAAVVMVACTTDNYETGDGPYSYMRADFCMLHAAGQGQADYAVTDERDTVVFASPVAAKWADRPDSMYRALVYHSTSTGEVFSVVPVAVVWPVSKVPDGEPAQDPLTIESVWMAGGFLNMTVAVKTGVPDSLDSKQKLGLKIEGITTGSDGRRTVHIQMLHSQNGVPQYYTTKAYLSMPLPRELKESNILLRVITYNGEKRYVLST